MLAIRPNICFAEQTVCIRFPGFNVRTDGQFLAIHVDVAHRNGQAFAFTLLPYNGCYARFRLLGGHAAGNPFRQEIQDAQPFQRKCRCAQQ